MITLITGAPGAGKTAALVDLLRELGKGRVVYVDGIPDLKLDHVPLDDAHQWPEVVPDGSIIVIDEVQRVWRPRGPGQKVPTDVAALETHRHRGLDFFIVTQGPNLVDRNVRALVGRHVHLRDVGVLGRWWYEWPEVCENPLSGWKNAPLKKRYRLPRAIFGSYKSASIHVKPIRSFPMALVFALVAIVGAGWFGWQSFGVVRERMSGGKPVAAAGAGPASVPPAPAGTAAIAPARRSATALEYRRQFTPVVPDRPETAPAYDELRKVVRMPRVVGGYCDDKGCRCFNQEGFDPGIGEAACFKWVRSPPFDPYYRKPDEPRESVRDRTPDTREQSRT